MPFDAEGNFIAPSDSAGEIGNPNDEIDRKIDALSEEEKQAAKQRFEEAMRSGNVTEMLKAVAKTTIGLLVK